MSIRPSVVINKTGAPAAAITVDGTGSSLTSTGEIQVGTTSTGTLTISDLAEVSGTKTTLGLGNGGNGTLRIESGGKLTNTGTGITSALIGSVTGSKGTATVTGAGSLWDVEGHFHAGASGEATLDVTDGGKVDVAGQFKIGVLAGSDGTVTLDGSESRIIVGDYVDVGNIGKGELTITDGAQLIVTGTAGTSNRVYVGVWGNDASGKITVDGAGSKMTTPGDVGIGRQGEGSMTISDGGVVDSRVGLLGAFQNGTGEVLVTGAGSAWTNSADIYFGSDGSYSPTPPAIPGADALPGGTGILTIADGAVVSADSGTSYTFGSDSRISTGTVYLGYVAAANATINIGAASGDTAVAAGTLDVNDVVFGPGTGTIVFNHIDTDYLFGADLSGTTGVVSVENGTTIFTGESTFAGTTTIASGATMQIGNGGINGSYAGAITDNGTLAFDRSDDLSYGNVIAGTGTVTKLGAGNLTLAGTNSYEGGTLISEGTLTGSSTSFGTGAITANAALVIDQPTSATFANAIAGSGTFAKTGAGTLTLTGLSGSFSGATSVTAGVLAVNGTLGNLASTVSVSNGAALGGAGTIGGSVFVADGAIGPGNSPGTLTIAGDLTLASNSILNFELGSAGNDLIDVGGNLVLNGTLNVTESGAFGAGLYRLINYDGGLSGGGLAFGTVPPGGDYYVQTSVAQQVNLVNTQGQTLNYWDGAGPKNNGAINGGSGIWTVAHTGPDSDNWTTIDGTVNAPFSNGSMAVFTAVPGTVTVDNTAGQVQVSGMQFAVDGYVVNGGSVELLSGQNTVRVGDGSLASTDMTTTITSQLIGAGSLEKSDLGNLVLLGNNTYAGGTLVTAGTLTGSATSFGAGDIANNAVLAFDQPTDATVDNLISGTGSLAKLGAGNLTLGANNTYAGGTLITAGNLTGSTTSFGAGGIVNNAALVIDQPTDAAFANVLSGNGALTKSGAGVLEMTGDSSSFSGPTALAAGGLKVNGSLAGSVVTAFSGTTLSGSGTVGGVVARSGSTVSPGNSLGTLSVSGDYAQKAGSTYAVEVAPGKKQSDLVAVSGAADLDDGALLDVSKYGKGAYKVNAHYTVLSAAGGVNGTYTVTGDTAISTFYQLQAVYDANNVYLDAVQTRSFGDAANTDNEKAVAGGLESLGEGNGLRDALGALDSDAEARDAFNQLSGEVHASITGAMVEDSGFTRAIAIDRIRAAFGDDAAGASCGGDADNKELLQDRDCRDTGAVWAEGFGSWGHIDGDGNAAYMSHDVGGFLIGADTPVAEAWRVGLLGGFNRATYDVSDRNASGSSDNYTVGIYGGAQWSALGLRLGTAYTWSDVSTDRNVAFTGFSDSLTGSYQANTAQVFGELGYRIDLGETALGQVSFEPFGGLAYVNVHTNRFTERGGLAALTSEAGNTGVGFSTLGVRAASAFTIAGLDLNASGGVGWRHAWGDTVPMATLAFDGGDPFDIAGVPIAKNAALIEAAITATVSRSVTLGVSYDGQFGDGAQSQSVRGNLAVRF